MLKSEAFRTQVKRSNTASMDKEGMKREFGSFH